MLTMLDVLGLISTGLPWMQRAQVRRLERIGARIPFSDESRHAIERAQVIAQVEGANAVTPMHLARAALDLSASPADLGGSQREQALAPAADPAAARALPFTYATLVVLVEAVRVAADSHRPAAMPDHLLLGILRRPTGPATQFLAARGVTLASLKALEGCASTHSVST
ncbi:MAG: hypothetical protein LCH84_19405 [Gemmatimonadetes bacterium]|nr:hypothetical protein [Gemmatimonadota bacterium]